MINTSSFSIQQTKTLIIEDQSTQVTKILPASIIIESGMFQLMNILTEVLSELKYIKIKCYDFSRDMYIEIDSNNCLIPLSFMINNPHNIILLKINRRQEQNSVQSGSSLFSLQKDAISQSSNKKQRSKERVIFEVIEIVKRWRELHNARHNCKKKSLQEAAQIVGLPKKSLDDYYYQLRLGQKYDFNFRQHLFDRIGILRNFLKNIKQSSLYDKNEKHPKKLKILDDFQTISQNYKNMNFQLMKQQVQQIEFDRKIKPSTQKSTRRNTQDIFEQQQMSQQQNKQVYNNFFNQFQYVLNQKDPFLSCDYNFMKKKSLQDYFQF